MNISPPLKIPALAVCFLGLLQAGCSSRSVDGSASSDNSVNASRSEIMEAFIENPDAARRKYSLEFRQREAVAPSDKTTQTRWLTICQKLLLLEEADGCEDLAVKYSGANDAQVRGFAYEALGSATGMATATVLARGTQDTSPDVVGHVAYALNNRELAVRNLRGHEEEYSVISSSLRDLCTREPVDPRVTMVCRQRRY